MSTNLLSNAIASERYAEAIRAAGNPRDQMEWFGRSGIVLQPKQLFASAAARECDFEDGPEEVAFGGARGGAKSHWAIAQLSEDCCREPGLNCLLLRKIGKANKENFDNLRRKVLKNVKTHYHKTDGLLTFENGSTIRCGHFQNERDVDAYLGLEYDVILIEEATTLSKSRADDVLSCLRTSKPNWRPRAYFTTNPGGTGHGWFKHRFITPWRHRNETITRFIQATVFDNQFVNPEYRRRLDMLTGWKRRAWLLGDWDIAAGQYFTTWREPIHCGEVPPVEDHWRLWMAMDYGFVHYNVVYLMGENGDGFVYYIDEHAERQWLPEAHSVALNAMLAKHGIKKERIETFLAGGDVFTRDRDGKTVADDYAKLGWNIQRANMSRYERATAMLRYLGDVERVPPISPKLLISDRCRRLADCIPSMVHDDARGEVVKKVDCDMDGFGGDDMYDCAGYGLLYVAGGPRVSEVPDELVDF